MAMGPLPRPGTSHEEWMLWYRREMRGLRIGFATLYIGGIILLITFLVAIASKYL